MKKFISQLTPLHFIYFMAFYLVTGILIYFFLLTFTPVGQVNNTQASEVKTSLIGAFGAIVGYLFGVVHSEAKKPKDEPIVTKQVEPESAV